MKLSLRQKNLYLLFLAFVLTVIAPLRALALPASEVMAAAGAGNTCSMAASETMDCCKVEKECCCSAAPIEPSDLESGVQSNQNAKFIPIKGTARPVISDWLSCSPALMQGLGQSSLSQQALATQRPLYILKRSLLI
ncbi:hypothetical protein BH11CYA1_BH11CYA1_20430 [soil metagenome]